MSELIDIRSNRATAHKLLLTTSSVLALTAYVASTNPIEADETGHPAVWIELGGQLESIQGVSTPFDAPFMSPDVVPDVYGNGSFAQKQKAPRVAFGGEGEITFQPKDSRWSFSAAIRYGRSNNKKHSHYQGPQVFHTFTTGFQVPKYAAAFSDTLVHHSESHAIIDFSAGKDIGIGALGNGGNSTINAGVRFAQFSIKSSSQITGRPDANLIAPTSFYNFITFHQYILNGNAARSFKGIGPSLSWNASAALLGNADAGELALDWGIDGSLLFGRQKAKIAHTTNASHFLGSHSTGHRYVTIYPSRAVNSTRSHSVVVPNLGGSVGLTMRKAGAKVSFGYRADFFFGATDTGIDTLRTSDLGFHGPFATISIGLGG